MINHQKTNFSIAYSGAAAQKLTDNQNCMKMRRLSAGTINQTGGPMRMHKPSHSSGFVDAQSRYAAYTAGKAKEN